MLCCHCCFWCSLIFFPQRQNKLKKGQKIKETVEIIKMLFLRLCPSCYQRVASSQHQVLPFVIRSDKPPQTRLFNTVLKQFVITGSLTCYKTILATKKTWKKGKRGRKGKKYTTHWEIGEKIWGMGMESKIRTSDLIVWHRLEFFWSQWRCWWHMGSFWLPRAIRTSWFKSRRLAPVVLYFWWEISLSSGTAPWTQRGNDGLNISRFSHPA